MGFGPFVSKEEIQKINAERVRRHGGLVQGGPGEMITPEEAERRKRAASPEAMRGYDARQGAPQASQTIGNNFVSDTDYVAPRGQFRGAGQRQRADGKGGWTDVNVVHNSQPAVLQGQNVRADGKGNWLNSAGAVVGTYKTGTDRTPQSQVPVAPDTRAGSVSKPTAYPTNAELQTIKPSKDFQKKTPPVETPPVSDGSGGGRGSKKTNVDGVEQTGTQMSTLGDFNDMYARVVGKHNMSATAYNPFESVHLHTQGDSREDMVNKGPSSYSPEEAAAFNSGQGIEWSSDQKADAPYTIPKPADVTSTEGAPQIVKSGATKVVKGVNGHEFGGDHEAPATRKQDRTSRLREEWMLGDKKDKNGNDLNTMQRLRGMRMEQGFDRQGDKFYARGSLDPANKSKPTEISQDQYRQAVASDAGAQQVATDLKDAYTSRIKNDQNPETTAPVLPTQADAESFGTSIAEQYLKNKKPIQK
jgi:hypothetical protein